MTHRIRIKDIAEIAGVSPGTVDRVLHNRGNISEESRTAVEKALKKVNYKPNLYLSSISLNKTYTITIAMPSFVKGEYWELVEQGIQKAIKEFDSIDIVCKLFIYNQFDIYSCREVFEKVLESSPNGVVIGSTFQDETTYLTSRLEDLSIPYIFVDSMVENTNPLACFSSDQYACGYLMSKLIDIITPSKAELALFQSIRIGDRSSNVTVQRKAGFMSYFQERNMKDKIHRVNFSVVNPEENTKLIGNFFAENPNIKGAVVLSSRGSVISDYFQQHNINDVKLICVDLTDKNYAAIKESRIEFVLAQRPKQQGFLAIKTLIEYFLYHQNVVVKNILPIDIITKENSEAHIKFRDA